MSLSQYPHLYPILDIARWAPSGDNRQPWRFEIVGSDHVRVHGAADLTNIYEYNNGQPTFISCGILIETIRIAASKFSRQCAIQDVVVTEGGCIKVDLDLSEVDGVEEDTLLSFVESRSVDRFSYKVTPLTEEAKQDLEACVGDNFKIIWFETFSQRLKAALLNCRSGDIRLRIPEAFKTHNKMFDYKKSFSEDRIPIKSLGASYPTMKFMGWVLQKWERVDFMNTYLAGTLAPQLEFDLLPGLKCSAHFLLSFKDQEKEYTPEKLLQAGAATQRFWLTAQKHGLVLQPSFSTLAYASYAQNNEKFTESECFRNKAHKLYLKVKEVFPVKLDQVMFMGRIGVSKKAPKNRSRSIRKPLSDLMYTPES